MTAYQFELRRNTAAGWTALNPVLADGEPGIEKDTRMWKVGDGATAWNSLAYFNPGATGATGAAGAAGAAGIGMAVPLVSGTWSAAGIGGSLSTLSFTNGVANAVPWLPDTSGHVDQLQVECVTTPGSTGAVSRLGLYAATASKRPGTLIADFGTVAMTGTGSQASAVIGSPPAVVANTLYFLCAVTQGAPTTVPVYRVMSAVNPLIVSAAATAQAGRSGYSHTGITGALADWDSTFTVQASVPIIEAHAV